MPALDPARGTTPVEPVGPTVFDHRRSDDGEHVGYLEMTDDDLFIPFDLLRVQRGEPMELHAAEAVLDEIGLRMLAEDWLLALPGEEPVRVRIVEIASGSVTVAPAVASSSVHVALTADMTAARTLDLPAVHLRPLRD
ncbi:serine/threonine protein phosphatase [Brachybacterium sp. DNPG3]